MPEIKTGDVLFIEGNTERSENVQNAQQYLIILRRMIPFLKSYNCYGIRLSHVLISMDKGMFIHATNGENITYTTLNQSLSKSLNYRVYRKKDFFAHSDIKKISDLPEHYQSFIWQLQNGYAGPITPQDFLKHAFHAKHQEMKFELGKKYALNPIRRFLNLKIRDASYCSKFVADLLYRIKDIKFKPWGIIFPAYLELKLCEDETWEDVTCQYTNIINNHHAYSPLIQGAIIAQTAQIKVQEESSRIQLLIQKVLALHESTVNRCTTVSELNALKKNWSNQQNNLLSAYETLIDKRWNDINIREVITKLNKEIDVKMLQLSKKM